MTVAQQAWYQHNRLRIADERRALRQQVLLRYGGQCACCGEADWRMLTFDHPAGGGNAERRAIGKFGAAFLATLVDGPLRLDLRVLCWNCNMAQGLYGQCHREAA